MLVPAVGWPEYRFGWGLRVGQGLDACDHNRFLFLFLFVCAPLVLGPCPPSHPFRFVDVVSFKVIWGRALVHLNAIKEEGKGMGRKKPLSVGPIIICNYFFRSHLLSAPSTCATCRFIHIATTIHSLTFIYPCIICTLFFSSLVYCWRCRGIHEWSSDYGLFQSKEQKKSQKSKEK